jgi:hypothetical protein
MTIIAKVPIVHEMPDPDIGPRTFVYIGPCRWQHEEGGAGLGPQTYGVWVRGMCDYRPAGGEVVCGADQWEPETINKIGQRGAFRAMPPTDEQIDEAVNRVMAMVMSAVVQ